MLYMKAVKRANPKNERERERERKERRKKEKERKKKKEGKEERKKGRKEKKQYRFSYFGNSLAMVLPGSGRCGIDGFSSIL